MDFWPVEGGKITSGFGLRDAPAAGASVYHEGIDISVPTGTAVMATIDGIVTAAGFSPARGNYVEVTAGSTKTAFGHLSDILAKVGDKVAVGQKIALSGNTGISTGPHLDYRVYQDGKAVDPASFQVGQFFSGGSLAAAAKEIANNHWWAIIGGLLVLGLIGGRNARQ